ncbi:archaeosortase/exosortase family protein [soil metagenome]
MNTPNDSVSVKKKDANKKVIRFVVVAFILYMVWFIGYDYIIAPDGRLDAWLNERVAVHSSWLLNLLGYSADTIPGVKQTIVRIDQTGMVGVGNPCNGMELFALFAGFILCFPGNWKTKAWFVPAGILLIHLINVIRAAALALNQLHNPASLEFNHHYTFTIIVYACIFGIWMLWVNKFSGTKTT